MVEFNDTNEIVEQPTVDADTFDLAAELAKPTQQRTFDFDAINQSTEQNIIDNINEVQNAEFNTDALKDIVETAEDKVADNFEAMYDTSTLAPAIVDGADAIMQQVFPILYEKSAFSDDERKLIKILAHKQKNQKETTLTDNDLSLMAACAEYESYIESLPLTANEKKQVIKPLSEILKDVNLQTTPSNALIIAVALIMLPRLLPLGLNKFLKNKNNENETN